MDWDNSYYTMSDENNYTIWSFLKKLWTEGKVYRGNDVVPWSGRSGTSYSQMEIIEGRKLVAHQSVFVRFPIKGRENEYLLVWTTTPWTLSSNVVVGVNVNLDYVKLKAQDGSIYYFAKENLEFKRLEKQFKEKKQWVELGGAGILRPFPAAIIGSVSIAIGAITYSKNVIYTVGKQICPLDDFSALIPS